ncbi:MAG: 30S ribosomal protein S6 [Saprospiraceae bacterium]|jgi:small subunit ribosomal protein S6
MKQYELTFIIDPVLSSDELKAVAQIYIDFITKEGGEIVHIDEMGLRPMAYSINKRSSGVFYCVEYRIDKAGFNTKIELNLRRDERIMRYLTIALDKFGVKFNEDKRAGKIGTVKKKADKNKKKTTTAVEEVPATEATLNVATSENVADNVA